MATTGEIPISKGLHMSEYESFADAYSAGLRNVLADGQHVPSVLDPLSKASDFGTKDRPYRELIAHSFRVRNPLNSLLISSVLPVKLPYCLGLLAWSLDGRNDVETPAYYRRGAHEYSDDQHTLSGAFGNRLSAAAGDQIEEIIGRIRRDPAHRRTFGLILDPADNFRESREYPCAVGVQMFLRGGALTWLTVMRAQQALTVLPYDGFLFMLMHQFAAASLGVPCGPYIHQSGTFHIYNTEIQLASRVVDAGIASAQMPGLSLDPQQAREALAELVFLERSLREAALAGDVATVDKMATATAATDFTDVARAALTTYAYRKLGHQSEPVTSSAASPGVSSLIAAI